MLSVLLGFLFIATIVALSVYGFAGILVLAKLTWYKLFANGGSREEARRYKPR